MTVVFEQLKRNTIIHQLKEYGYIDVEGKSDKELIKILSYYKVKVESPHSTWF